MSPVPLSKLDRNERTNVVRSTLANAVAVLQHDPSWAAERLWYDEFLDRVLTSESPTREWRDDDDTRLTVYMQEVIRMSTVSEASVSSAVRYVARQRARHCVREWLESLAWDGVERIAHAFEDYWGAQVGPEQPREYLSAVSANFFIGMVARVMQPGCQLDNMVVFEGSQGLGKSSALRILGGPWYAVAAESVTSKDFFQHLPGKLIHEIGEMHAFSKVEREKVKIAISTPCDRYRASYGRRAMDHARQCIFAGTTNQDDWGNDDTGLRRFWPVRCASSIDLRAIETHRPDFFAEAVARYRAGASWWETPAVSTAAVQQDRQSDDVWLPMIRQHLANPAIVAVTSDILLRDVLKIRDGDMSRSEQLRIGSIMRRMGWKRQTVRIDTLPCMGYAKPDDYNGE